MPTAMDLLSNETCDDILTVDLESRQIIIPDTVKNLGVESDDSVRVLHFQVPRHCCGVDLATFTIRVNYKNTSGAGGTYDISNFAVEDETIKFDWLVERHVTVKRGDVKFNVCFREMDGEEVKREFNTTTATLPVLEGLETGEEIVHEYADVFEQLRDEVKNDISTEVDNAAESAAAAAVQHAETKLQGYVSNAEQAKDAAIAAKNAAEKVKNEVENVAGGNFMNPAVYDPQNKNTDIFAYVDDKLLEGGGDAIIDVVELPTENINDKALYRKAEGVVLIGQDRMDSWTVNMVDTLPAVGDPAMDVNSNANVYFQTSDNCAYGYVDATLSMMTGVPEGWYSAGVLVPALGSPYGGVVYAIDETLQDGTIYLLIEYTLYNYKKEWASQKSVGKAGSAMYSYVFGSACEASSDHTFAVGHQAVASSDYAVALGCKATASGVCSFAQGDNTDATDYCSHAEGKNTEATGTAAHAEGGDTHATGNFSHAEGDYTHASGHYSHAEGFDTRAASDNQHVQGKYNIIDAENKYAHIVGNGDFARSNAHTVDWNGLGWFAGGLKVGGTGQDDANAKDVIAAAPVSASDNGKVLRVVNGVPTWVNVSTVVYVGNAAPAADVGNDNDLYLVTE